MSSLDLGVIGNCCFGGLIDGTGKIVWSCLPRFDGDPVFNSLLNNGGKEDQSGFFSVDVEQLKTSSQSYERNTAILKTVLKTEEGTSLEITDFAPRFYQFDRIFRPTTIVRLIRPLAGTPKIRIRLRPKFGYGSIDPAITRGSNHIRFVGPDLTLRLTTDATVSYLLDETWFLLTTPITMILGPDESLTQSIDETARVFYDGTKNYWRRWCRSLSIPFEWQDAVIRAAMTLKLCTFEETGAIIAAMTTSIPEAPHSERNWDYRFCWLRDAYFVIHTLNRLSATQTLEHYLRYINNVVANTNGDLQPLYGLTLANELEERNVESLKGYRGMGPVRVGNQAYKQSQNDVFGSVILAAAQTFFDSRLSKPGDIGLYRQLSHLGQQAVERFDTPDAGIWELRTKNAVHTFSALMCWAAADRLARIAARLGIEDEAVQWRRDADLMHERINEEAWNADLGSYVATFGGEDVDASLLLMHELGFVPCDDHRFLGTIETIERVLKRGNHVFRYANADDFGVPKTAFTVCTFWYIEALALCGRKKEARDMFEQVLACRNGLGLLSEDIDPSTGELWGNFPQTYSMVGLIKCAMRLSESWEEAF
jgi:GH15 family glucan-1,4-alpha-glucosidase